MGKFLGIIDVVLRITGVVSLVSLSSDWVTWRGLIGRSLEWYWSTAYPLLLSFWPQGAVMTAEDTAGGVAPSVVVPQVAPGAVPPPPEPQAALPVLQSFFSVDALVLAVSLVLLLVIAVATARSGGTVSSRLGLRLLTVLAGLGILWAINLALA